MVVIKDSKKFEIFSGTGGVGKTTLAASRAISLAQAGKKVLIITIDPAKRLKELLGIKDSLAGEVIKVEDPFSINENLDLYVELMNPESTFKKIVAKSNCNEVLDNRILKILTRPYGGLNEILSIVELNLQYQTEQFDTIVLDTPPGSHFLDFLDSVQKIQVFFDQSFIEVFEFVGKKANIPGVSTSKKIFNKVVSTGVKKLLSYLNKVTGDQFVEEFIDAVIAIYKTKDTFLQSIEIQKKLKDNELANWFLVTSVDHDKLDEAMNLKNSAKGLITQETFILINKCLSKELHSWEPTKLNEVKLKETLILKENKLKSGLKEHFSKVLEFPEVISLSPLEHVNYLSKSWSLL